MEIPKTLYTKEPSGGHVAYQVFGEGPLDVVVVPNWITHVEAMWEIPSIERSLERLASFARVIVYDFRGAGMSDPVPLDAIPTLEQRIDEVVAVLDATGSERAAFIGFESGGPMAAMFAATHPERTSALVLANSYARPRWAEDFTFGFNEQQVEAWILGAEMNWGTATTFGINSSEADRVDSERWARYQRQAASPGTVAALIRQAFENDARGALPLISVPTLVLMYDTFERVGGTLRLTEHTRYLAEHIPGAALVELPHGDQTADLNAFMDEIREFLTGVREVPDADRVLATVLFSDIVDSTALASSLGDRGFREVLDSHDEMVRRQLERFRGREVKALGDGFMATFDGPARAIRCATAIRDQAQRLNIEVRVGLHTGEVEIRGEDIGGIGVHIASRVADLAPASTVYVSRTVCDLVAGSGIAFKDAGEHELKGIPGNWQLFAVDA